MTVARSRYGPYGRPQGDPNFGQYLSQEAQAREKKERAIRAKNRAKGQGDPAYAYEAQGDEYRPNLPPPIPWPPADLPGPTERPDTGEGIPGPKLKIEQHLPKGIPPGSTLASYQPQCIKAPCPQVWITPDGQQITSYGDEGRPEKIPEPIRKEEEVTKADYDKFRAMQAAQLAQYQQYQSAVPSDASAPLGSNPMVQRAILNPRTARRR